MNKKAHRALVAEAMADNSILICYAGIPLHSNEDDYYDFEVNSNFFWLTGLEREKQALVMIKMQDEVKEYLFIEEKNELAERWTGKMPSQEDVARISGVDKDNVLFVDRLDSFVSWNIDFDVLQTAYFDTFRNSPEDLYDYNLVAAKRFAKAYPSVRILNLRPIVARFRKTKDAEEVGEIRRAIGVTANGLKEVLRILRPGMKEYQVQAVFECSCKYQGATRFSFTTISAAGLNGCNMHYVTNRDEIKDGDLLLLDLGAKYGNYCSDITRTYPANGKYTPRQRQFYDLVLKANLEVKKAARPGVTLKDLNDVAKKVLGEGLVELGLISDPAEVGKYYMHSVSHSIGIDCHDVTVGGRELRPGWIISDEPGLYIDEEKIGIRIEDDLLITEDGCECLSESILRDPDQIEAYMAAHRR